MKSFRTTIFCISLAVISVSGCSSSTSIDNPQSPSVESAMTPDPSKSTSPSESASPISGQESIVSNLATLLQDAGLGCEDIDLQETPILYEGARIDCTILGEELRIEAYPEEQFKEMAAYVADLGFSETLVLTDGKTWTVTASEAVLAKVQKVIGGAAKAFGAI